MSLRGVPNGYVIPRLIVEPIQPSNHSCHIKTFNKIKLF